MAEFVGGAEVEGRHGTPRYPCLPCGVHQTLILGAVPKVTGVWEGAFWCPLCRTLTVIRWLPSDTRKYIRVSVHRYPKGQPSQQQVKSLLTRRTGRQS